MKLTHYLTGIICLFSLGSALAQTNKPQIHLPYDTNVTMWPVELESTQLSRKFIPRFKQELDKYAPIQVIDDYYTFSAQRRLMIDADKKGYGIHEEINSKGLNTFMDLGGDTLRETAAIFVPEELGEFGHVLRWSIGGTHEEKVKVTSIDYSAAENQYLKDVRDDGKYQIGLRPFRKDPYVYFSTAARNSSGEPIAYELLRYRYEFPNSSRIEEQLTLPLARTSYRLIGGVSYAPFPKKNERQYGFSGRVQRVFGKKSLKAASLGIDQNLASVQFSMFW